MMTDTLEIKHTTAHYRAWSVPGYARLVAGPDSEGEDIGIKVADAPRDVIDALAQRWLDNLYASRGERSPFKLPPKVDCP